MAIGRMIRPVIVVDGQVDKITERKGTKGPNAGKVFAHEIQLKQPSDALLIYTLYTRDSDKNGFPAIGDYVAVECSAEDSPQYGTQLNYERPAFEALDRIQSNLAAA